MLMTADSNKWNGIYHFRWNANGYSMPTVLNGELVTSAGLHSFSSPLSPDKVIDERRISPLHCTVEGSQAFGGSRRNVRPFENEEFGNLYRERFPKRGGIFYRNKSTIKGNQVYCKYHISQTREDGGFFWERVVHLR